jgi:hypothetical protein
LAICLYERGKKHFSGTALADYVPAINQFPKQGGVVTKIIDFGESP